MTNYDDKVSHILDEMNITSYPIPIKRIIKKLNVKLEKFDLGDEVSGVLVVEHGIPRIAYNPYESEVRQRFTIAHELGHYLLHLNSSQKKNKLFVETKVMYRSVNNKADYKKEQEANSFAASILMPKSLVEKEFHKLHLNLNYTDDDIIEVMARKFKVSEMAMTYRLINLNLIRKF